MSGNEIAQILFLFFLPKSQVFFEKFDNGFSITEIFFLEFVNLVESFLESFVSQLTGLLVVLHYLVVEH